MKRFWPRLAIAIATIFVSPAIAQDAAPAPITQPTTPAAGVAPQYYTLNLQAGTSLISAPLNSGQALARDTFQGLPPDWPLFWGWNSASQSWLTGDQAPMTLTGGFEVYVPTPTTVVVAGQPYDSVPSVTARIYP